MTPLLSPITTDTQSKLRMALHLYLGELGLPRDPAAQMSRDALEHPDRYSYWIDLPDVPQAGFALAERASNGMNAMLAYTVFPKRRFQGVGAQAAFAVFARHPGAWQIAVLDQPRAKAFWEYVLIACPAVHDVSRHPAMANTDSHVYRFHVERTDDAA